ncbi:triose-phosphate isomerase [Helicobacter sp. 12S02634-8]|uniref:triose-phosphate isomerase n=1 Tax=Helicobacter sp. 12S02634-8 TaxID=1476199 RepID=UPI000BA7C953|nr:triose-phosphate isomerase [Helicobacter sp. 12S02634-8]PAF47746.1 triose-phosphate isomerase [Helicobacter sp. 12S02634-8]
MRKIIAANFKANLTRASTEAYLKTLQSKLTPQDGVQVYIFPALSNLMSSPCGMITIGTQNAYPAYNGAFTGEIGLEILQELGITTIIIGHSERRNLLAETQEICAKKFAFFAQKGFEIFYCIGENLSVREKGLDAVEKFIHAQLEGIDTTYDKLILAYEPIWAIGTGVSASLEQISQTHQIIKNQAKAPLLYGGSVNPQNAKEILALDEVDGVLVGSAALTLENFYPIIQASPLISKPLTHKDRQ